MHGTGLTDVGVWRDNNEDSFTLVSVRALGKEGPEDFLLGLVADGMGGAAAGEIASHTAVDTIPREVAAGLLADRPGKDPVAETSELLKAAVLAANARIVALARDHEEYEGMGTTSTLALLREGIIYFAHVGDSRGYLWREGQLRQVTEDHSWVGEMVRAGVMTPEQAKRHPRRNEIGRALGIWEHIDVDVYRLAMRAGDVLLLCSDGLWEMVSDERIQTVLALPSAPEGEEERLHFWAQTLINEANSAGGEDNVSVVLLHVEEKDVVAGAEALLAPKPTTRRRRRADPNAPVDLTTTRRYSEGEGERTRTPRSEGEGE